MLESGGGTAGELLPDDVVLPVLLMEAEELCSSVSMMRASCGGWRSSAHVEEPVWCTRGSIEGSQSFTGSQGNWLGGRRGAGRLGVGGPR
jgi:hypothetical protein